MNHTEVERLKAKIGRDGNSSFGPSTVDVRALIAIYEAEIENLQIVKLPEGAEACPACNGHGFTL